MIQSVEESIEIQKNRSQVNLDQSTNNIIQLTDDIINRRIDWDPNELVVIQMK